MTLSRSFVRNAVTTPLDARLMNMASIVSHNTGEPRVGVIGTGPTALVTTTGTMNVAVGIAEFATSKGKADGVAIFANDGTVNVPIAAAPVSNSRIDVIWVKHNDNTTGDADSLPIFGVTAGTAAASPVKPAIGVTGALELATLRIYAGTVATNGGTNLVTNTYDMTAARGGVVPFRTKADLDLWTTPQFGQIAIVLANGSMYARGVTSWIPLAYAAGILMRRSATAGAVASSDFTNLSATTFWTEANRSGGFVAYANGVTVPYTGIYRISYTLGTSTIGCVAGVTVNKSSLVALADLEIPSTSSVAQGVAVATASAEIALSGGDVLRLYGIANSGSATWRTEANLSIFQVEFVRAA